MAKWFKPHEYACKCGCGMVMTEYALERFDAIREMIGHRMRVNSGARCPAYNAKIGGAPKSQHTYGCAMDIKIESEKQRLKLISAAALMGAGGIGNYKSFLHIDFRPKSNPSGLPTVWAK